LVEWRNAKTKEEKALEVVLNPNVDYRYVTNTKEFSKIPGSPIAYWLSKINIFSMKSFRDFFISGGRNKTHNNDKYVRFFWRG
jgi:hypothetical protein